MIRQVTKLVTGVGVDYHHWPAGVVFRKGEPAPGRVTPNNNWRIPGLLWADGVLFAFVEQYTRDCHPGVRPTLCRARTRTRHRPRLTSPSPAGRVEPVQGHRHEAL